MRGESSPPAETVNGHERRRFPRQRLNADAVVRTSRGASFSCKIRDFCLAGIAVSWIDNRQPEPAQSFGKGDPIVISFAAARRGSAYQINAQVARVLSDGLGLEFTGQDPAALTALQTLAEEFEKARTSAPNNIAAGNGRAAASLNRVRKVTEQQLQRHLGEFAAQIENLMYRQARQAQTNIEQTELCDAVPIVAKHRDKIIAGTTARVLQGLSSSPAPLAPTPAPVSRLPPNTSLSLVGKDELEDLLALADIISRAEQRFKNNLFDIEQRLSQILQRDIDRATDPLGPSAICNAFANALQDVGLNEIQRRAAYHAFQDGVIPSFANLYQAVNQSLINDDVLPTLRPTVRKTASAPARNTRSPDATAGREANVPPGTGTADLNEMSQDLAFRAAQTLFGLNRMMTTPGGNFGGTWTGTFSGVKTSTLDINSATTSYSHEELLRALGSLQSPAPTGYDVPQHSGANVKDQLIAALQSGLSNSGTVDGRPRRNLRQGDAEALDLVQGIFAALNRDNRTSDPLRQEINRLQIPLHALALTDPAFFSNKDHPARQFINRVAQLYEDTQALSSLQSGAVSNVVDRLLTNIEQYSEVGSQVFKPALSELDQLVEQQAKQYGENIAQLVAECAAQQSFLRAKRKHASDSVAANDIDSLIPPNTPPELRNELRMWLDRARNLRAPDLVRFDLGDGHSRQLRVAWISDNGDQFVFADSQGRKANSTTLQELAMLLRRGKATVVGHNELSVVDRALHGVLYEMHARIERQTLYDPVTGLMNRKRFLQRLDSAIQSVVRDGIPHLLVLISIGGYEDMGEEFGDQRLRALQKKISDLISQQVGSPANLARLDASTFALVLENATESKGRELLEPFANTINKTRVKVHEHVFNLRAHLVTAVVDGQCGESDALLRNLERHLNTTQDSAASPTEHLEIQFDAASPTGVDWAAELPAALASDDLHLYCLNVLGSESAAGGPLHARIEIGIMDVKNRLNLLRHTVLPAELNDDILLLDQRIIRESLSWFGAHREQLEEYGGCSLRLRAPTLKDERTIDFLLEQLIESGIPPGRLCIEISETDVAHCLPEAERLIRTLSEFGCEFCISAYGRSELSHSELERLRIGCLMLDPRMIKGIEHSPADYAVVKSMTEIAHLLGKKIIAEQVLSAAARNKLAEIGLDYVELDYAPAQRLKESR